MSLCYIRFSGCWVFYDFFRGKNVGQIFIIFIKGLRSLLRSINSLFNFFYGICFAQSNCKLTAMHGILVTLLPHWRWQSTWSFNSSLYSIASFLPHYSRLLESLVKALSLLASSLHLPSGIIVASRKKKEKLAPAYLSHFFENSASPVRNYRIS